MLQEVFAAAFNAMLADEREINVRPWLYRIARNRSLNHLRRAQAVGMDSMDVHLSEGGADDRRQGPQARGVPAADRRRAGSAGDAEDRAAAARDRRALLRADRRGDGDHGAVGEVAARARARVARRGRRGAAALLRGGARWSSARSPRACAARAAPVRRHLRTCDRCTAFSKHLRQNNKALAALFPLGPLLLLKKVLHRPPRHDRRGRRRRRRGRERRGAPARVPRCRSASGPSPRRPPPASPPPRSSPPAPSRSSTPPSRAPRPPRSSRRSSPSTPRPPRPPRRRPPRWPSTPARSRSSRCTWSRPSARSRRRGEDGRGHEDADVDADRPRRPRPLRRRRPPSPAPSAHGGDTTTLPSDTLGTAETGSGTYAPPPAGADRADRPGARARARRAEPAAGEHPVADARGDAGAERAARRDADAHRSRRSRRPRRPSVEAPAPSATPPAGQ